MTTSNKALETFVSATNALGRAFAGVGNKTKEWAKAGADVGYMPTDLLPLSNENSTTNDGKFNSLLANIANGWGKLPKRFERIELVNHGDLFRFDLVLIRKETRELVKNSKGEENKHFAKQVELYNEAIKLRSSIDSQIRPKLRDMANALVTAHKNKKIDSETKKLIAKGLSKQDAKAKAIEAGNMLAYELRELHGGLWGKAPKAEKDIKKAKDGDKKPDGNKTDVVLQQAKNLLSALQNADSLPANGNKLIKELTTLIESRIAH